MDNRKFNVGVIILLSIILCCVIFFNKSRAFALNTELRTTKDSITSVHTLVSFLEKNIHFSNKYSFFRLADSNFLRCKEMRNDDLVKYTNLIPRIKSNRFTLLLRYTEIGCDMCSDMTIEKIKKIQKSFPIDVVVLVDFTNIESYLLWRKGAKVDFDVFYVDKDKLPMDSDSPTFSYLLLINNDQRIIKTLIPNSGYPMLIDDFLQSVAFTAGINDKIGVGIK